MTLAIFRQEWHSLRGERSLWIVVVLIALLAGYGVYNGATWTRFQVRTLSAVAKDQQERLEKLRAEVRKVEADRAKSKRADPRDAASVGGTTGVPYAVLPPAALAPFSIGQSDLYPYYFKLSLKSRPTVTESDEIENPVNLLSGRFDLSFAVVYLMPLLILALTYNVLSAEKENGTLAVSLSQPVALGALIARKTLFRAIVLAVIVIASSLTAAALTGVPFNQPGVFPRLLLWIAVVLSYGSFWFVLAVAINALGKSSATNALTLAAIWLAFVLLIPASINLLAESLYPVPSRVEMIQAMREASIQATQKGSTLLARYWEDHPDLASPSNSSAPDASFATYAVQMEVDRLTEPVFAHFESQIAAQQGVVNRFRFSSPAILAQNALNDISGTGVARYRDFRRAFDGFLTEWQDYFFRRISQRALVSSQDLARMPKFSYPDESVGTIVARLLAALAGILALVAGIGAYSIYRLARYPIAG
jgi:ABC-2 type transport system permease protein